MARFELSDLPATRWRWVFIVGGTAWLLGRSLTTGLGGSLGELDLAAAILALTVPVIVLLGPRTIVVDDAGIRVTRRGRMVLGRSMAEVAGIQSVGPMSRLMFVDGTWLLWSISGPDWGPPTDFIVSQITADQKAPAAFTSPYGTLRIPADTLRFPPRCLGCGAQPEFMPSLTVRRGIDLGLGAFFVARSVPIPACADCDDRRRRLDLLVSYGPIAGIVATFFVPWLTPYKGTWLLWIVGVLLVLFLVLRNRGGEWVDAWVWGVRGRLAVDGRIELKVRDAALRTQIVEASRTGASVETAMPRLEF